MLRATIVVERPDDVLIFAGDIAEVYEEQEAVPLVVGGNAVKPTGKTRIVIETTKFTGGLHMIRKERQSADVVDAPR